MSDLVSALIELTCQIQQIPAPPFGEGERARFIREQFQHAGLDEVFMDEVPNVYGCWKTTRSRAAPLIVSAHLDTVFPLGTPLRIKHDGERLRGPGLGDNALGVAALLGLLWTLRQRGVELPFDLWLVANSGEEGLGNLRGMQAVVERFGAQVSGYLVLEGLALGYVYHQGIGVQRYRIIARGPGGHPWADPDRPSAIHELVRLSQQLLTLPLPKQPRTTLNIGCISGGSGINVLAAEAQLELDLRSEDPAALAALVRQVEQAMRQRQKNGIRFELESLGRRPAGALPERHPWVKLAQECLRRQGIEPSLAGGSTDANLPLSRGYPALVLGITRGGNAHTLDEYIELPPIALGIAQLADFVSRLG